MKNINYFLLVISILFFFSCENKNQTEQPKFDMKKQFLFVGTYTKKEGHVDGKGKGIYFLEFNPNELSIERDTLYNRNAFHSVNPSFLAVTPDKKTLLAVNELNPNDGDSGTISAYAIDSITHELFYINNQKTGAFAPCHVSIDATGQFAFVANYVGGVLKVFPIYKSGALGEASQTIKLEGSSTNKDRQEASHPHSVNISPNNRFAYVPDLGTDKVMIYQLDLENGKMLPAEQPFIKVQNGAGPRHFSFHPNGKNAYVVNELDATVNVFNYINSTGQITEIQSITTLPDDYKDFNGCADIHVHPSGKFLYASNRGHNSIVIYKIDDSGKLTLVGHESTKGKFPRNFILDSSGHFLMVANQNTNGVFLFKINQETGELEVVDKTKVPTPVCLKFWK